MSRIDLRRLETVGSELKDFGADSRVRDLTGQERHNQHYSMRWSTRRSTHNYIQPVQLFVGPLAKVSDASQTAQVEFPHFGNCCDAWGIGTDDLAGSGFTSDGVPDSKNHPRRVSASQRLGAFEAKTAMSRQESK
jgi:hypothetical protein